MSYTLLSEKPVPIWIVNANHEPSIMDDPVMELHRKLRKEIESTGQRDWLRFRGVSIDRLYAVLTTGVDKEPVDAPIYCAEIEKAWEYGREFNSNSVTSPWMVYVLRGRFLEKTVQALPLDAAPGEIEKLTEIYPHRYEDADCLWFSRIENPHLGYEVPYGYWIPGNAKDALVAVFLFVLPDQVKDFLQNLLGAS